jgi:thymidylate synthase
MEKGADTPANDSLTLLAVTQQAQWGDRIADSIDRYKPATWRMHRWAAPRILPAIVDDPDDYLPGSLPQADLVVALGETAGVVQLLPDIAKLAKAKAVLVPIDRNESVPAGLVTQLRQWLDDMGVAVVFPRPFCTLTETTINRPPLVESYDVPLVSQFARHFGQPKFEIDVNAEGQIAGVRVARDAACGCARYVAEGLVGHTVGEAEYEAGMLHHHYPCLSSMNQDADYHDTLMHVSGHALREAVKEQIQSHLEPTPYFQPTGKVDS